MVEAAEYGDGDQLTFAAESLLRWRVTAQPLMWPRWMVVLHQVFPQQPLQMAVVQHDDMIQQLSA